MTSDLPDGCSVSVSVIVALWTEIGPIKIPRPKNAFSALFEQTGYHLSLGIQLTEAATQNVQIGHGTTKWSKGVAMSSGGGDVDEDCLDGSRVGGGSEFQDAAEGGVFQIIRAEHLQGNRGASAGISVPSGNTT